MKHIVSLLIFILIASACERKETIVSQEWSNDTALKVVDVIKFPLDSLTKRYGNKMSFSQRESKLYLYNNYTHSFYQYSLSAPEEYRIISLNKEGPNRIGKVDAFFAISEDSIITINSGSSKIAIVNASSEKIYEAQILGSNENGLPLMFTIDYRNGQVYVPLSSYAKTKNSLKRKNVLIYNLKTREKNFIIDTPDQYADIKDWADRFHVKNGTLVGDDHYAFSWSPGKLYVAYNLRENSSRQVNFTSELIADAKKADKILTDRLENRYFQRTNTWNQSIYYSDYGGLILRPFSIGKNIPEGTQDLYGDFKSLNNDDIFEITEIYNKRFEKVGELLGVSFLNNLFDTADGIYIEDYSVDPEDENVMAFKLYQVDEIN